MRCAKEAIIVTVLVVLGATMMLAAQEADKAERVVPELKAYRINPHPPTIDGNLDDAIWKSDKVEFASVFTQREPDEGSPASESTLVAVAYDEEAIYVAFWCYDSEPDKIARQLVRRDRHSQSDRVTLRLDPYHDHQSGNSFEVSAAGVQRDSRYYNENNSDMSWDAVWESGVKAQPWGWSAEMRIPYHCLRFSEKDIHTWGIDFERLINRKEEYSRWAFTPSSKGRFVSNFGHLTNIKGVRPGRHLEIMPYIVSSGETEPKSLSNTDGRNFTGNTGFDVKYALSSNLTFDATINPDFGQVELDQPVLNLSTYETWFPERRPFFVEGSDLFQTEFDLFYSRRIGRSPGADVDDPELDYYTDYPRATTILGAAKLTGKVGPRTSIAVLSALTEEETASYRTLEGDSRTGVVEAAASYTIMRVKQEVLKNSNIGGMLTLASQDGFHPAVTGGIDWRLYTDNGIWTTRGQVIMSRVDNEVVGVGIDGTFEKASGKHVRAAVGYTSKDPNLDINRLGYSGRSDRRFTWAWAQYRTQDNWWIIRNSWNNINLHSGWNYDGINNSLGGNFNTYIEFLNFWSLGVGFSMQAEKYSDDETRDNGLWEWPVYPTFAWWFSLNTDSRKKVSFTLNPNAGSDRGGSHGGLYVGADFRPASNMEFSFGGSYTRNRDVTRWVENVDDSSLFADLHRDQIFLHASASVVFNRNLSCQLSAEGLVSGMDYGNYRYYRGGNSYSGPVAGFNNDYNYSALNSTMLVRWEYNPGSTLYLVWTRARSEFNDQLNDLKVSRDIDQFFSAGAQNLFLIKASYWWNI